MPQLEVAHYPSQLFWLIICLAVLGWVMNFFLIPRLCASMELRAQKINSDQAALNKLQNELKTLQENNHSLLNKTYHEASAVLHVAAEKLKEEKEQVIRAFDRELTTKTEKALEELRTHQTKLQEKIPEVVVELMRELTPKLLDLELSNQDQERIKTVLKDKIRS